MRLQRTSIAPVIEEDPNYYAGGIQKRICVEDILGKTWRTIKVGWEWSWKRGKLLMGLEGSVVTPNFPTFPSREGGIKGEEKGVRR